MASKRTRLDDGIEESEENIPVEVQIIREHAVAITRRIDAVDLVDYFKANVFTEAERQKIKRDLKNNGEIEAARTLLDFLIRKRTGWFEDLLGALRHDGLEGRYDDIAALLRKGRPSEIDVTDLYNFEPSAYKYTWELITQSDDSETDTDESATASTKSSNSSPDELVDVEYNMASGLTIKYKVNEHHSESGSQP